ncbi:hypothetical protein INR49_023246 [Caranx melampygus]|nr:hypothetical protein INR49_023246 [Caranx melampygus]
MAVSHLDHAPTPVGLYVHVLLFIIRFLGGGRPVLRNRPSLLCRGACWETKAEPQQQPAAESTFTPASLPAVLARAAGSAGQSAHCTTFNRVMGVGERHLTDGAEEEDDEFGDFGTFSGVSGSISLTEFDTPTTFNQNQALTATSPPELLNNRGLIGFSQELSKANGVVPPSLLGGGSLDRTDVKKVVSGSPGLPLSDTAGGELADCNGGGTEVLTNGFATFDVQGSPSSQNSVHSHIKGTSSEDTGSVPPPADQDPDCPPGVGWPDAAHHDRRCASEQGTTSEDDVRDTNRTGPNVSVPAEALDRDSQQRDEASAQDSETVCTNEPLPLPRADRADGDESKDAAGCGEHNLSPDTTADSEAGQSDETETETETSFGRPLSTDALEEYGDMSTTGSVPSPPLQGDTATPADHSQLAEDDEDEDFGDFGDVGGKGFADFELQEQSRSQDMAARTEDDDDFGDFNSPKRLSCGQEGGDGGAFADFPVSDSFGNFSSAVGGADGKEDAGWSAFGEQQAEGEESWAAFGTEQSGAPLVESRGGREGQEEGEEEEEEEWQETEGPAVREEAMRTDRQAVSLSSRLEKLFHSSFQAAAPLVEEQVVSLKILWKPPHTEEARMGRGHHAPGRRAGACGRSFRISTRRWASGTSGGAPTATRRCSVARHRHRNILFTGQKKQPVIVPMYAASLVSTLNSTS